MPSAGGAAQATGSGFLGLFGISRESCAFGGPPDVDLLILCHEARGLDLSPGEQVFVSLRDQKRSDPEKLTAPGTPWQLRSAKADSVLHLRVWAAPDEEAARTDAARRRVLGELRLPLSALRACGLSMLYQTWLTLDVPGLDEGTEVGPGEVEAKMAEGSRHLYQPKLCLSLCQMDSASSTGKIALSLDAPDDVRVAQWSALLSSQMQHQTMSSVMHRQSLKAPRNGTPTRPTDATHVAQQIQDADAKVRGQAPKIQELRGQLHRARSGLPFNDLPRVSYGQESVQRSQSLLAETKKARDLNESLKAEIGAVKLNLDKVAEEANGKIDAANERIRSLRRERDDALKEGDRLRAEGERLMSRQEAVRKETEDLVQQKELLLTVVEELHRTCNNAGIKEVARHSIKDIGEFTANFRLT